MARPRKNPFGERKDTGIGYDGTRTNNPFATPTNSRRRREQWDMANQANLVWQEKQLAKQRAEEARQRAEAARQEAKRKEQEKLARQKFIRDNKLDTRDIDHWTPEGKPYFNQTHNWQSQGFEKDENGLITELFRSREGKFENRDPFKTGNYKINPKTGEAYITLGDGSKHVIGTNKEKYFEAQQKKAVEQSNAAELNRKQQVEDKAYQADKKRAEILKQQRLIDHRKKTIKGYDAKFAQNKQRVEDEEKLRLLTEEQAEIDSEKSEREYDAIIQSRYTNYLKSRPYTGDLTESLRSLDGFEDKGILYKNIGPAGTYYMAPLNEGTEQEALKPPEADPVITSEGKLNVTPPTDDQTEETKIVQSAGESTHSGITAQDAKTRISAYHAEKNPKDEEAQNKLAKDKAKKDNRNATSSPEAQAKVPIILNPPDVNLAKLYQNIEDLTNTDEGKPKLPIGTSGYDGTNLSIVKKSLQEQAKQYALKYVYDQLVADLNGNANSAKIHTYLLMGKDVGSIFGFGKNKVRPTTVGSYEDMRTGMAFKKLRDEPSKLNKADKKLIAARLKEHGYIFAAPIQVDATAEWFDQNVNVSALEAATKRVKANLEAEREAMKYSWRHVEVDPRTGLGFSMRLKEGSKGKPIFEYKIDGELGDAIDPDTGEPNIKTKEYKSWKEDKEGGLMEDHMNFVSENLAVTRKDVGFFKDTLNRFVKTYGRNWYNIAYQFYRPFNPEATEQYKKLINEQFDKTFPTSVASDFKARTSTALQTWNGLVDGFAQLYHFSQGYQGAGAIGGYTSNFAAQIEGMISEAYEAGMSPRGTVAMYANAAGIAYVDTLADRFLIKSGSVFKSALPKSVYQRMLTTAGGRYTAAVGGVAAKAGVEGTTETVQTWWENVYARLSYDPDRKYTEGGLVSFYVGALLGGSMGVRSFAADLNQRKQLAEEFKIIEKELEKVEAAEKGGETAKEELTENAGTEIDTTDIIDNRNAVSTAHANKAADLINLGLAKRTIANILANQNLSPATQEAIIESAVTGGESLYNAIAVGNQIAEEFPVLSDENINSIFAALEVDGEATLMQKDAAVSAIQGYIFISREAESILNDGKATRSEYAQMLIDLGIATQDSEGAMKVNTSAARVLPRNLAEQIRIDADVQARGNIETNVEPAIEGETTTDNTIDSNIKDGREITSAVADAEITEPVKPQYEVRIVPNTDPENYIPLPPMALSSVEKGIDIGNANAEMQGMSDYTIEVVPLDSSQISETPASEETELKPAKKVEAQGDTDAQPVLDSLNDELRENYNYFKSGSDPNTGRTWNVPKHIAENEYTELKLLTDAEKKGKYSKLQTRIDAFNNLGTGKRIVLVRGGKDSANGAVNYKSDPNILFVNADSVVDPSSIIHHENLHTIENGTPEERNLYKEFRKKVDSIIPESEFGLAPNFDDIYKKSFGTSDGLESARDSMLAVGKAQLKLEAVHNIIGDIGHPSVPSAPLTGKLTYGTKEQLTDDQINALQEAYVDLLAKVSALRGQAQQPTDLTTEQRETLEQERDTQEAAEQTAQEQREAEESEAGIRPVTRTGEFGTARPGTGEFGQDKPTGQNRSGAVDILDDQQTTQTPQGNVQEDINDPSTFTGESETVRQRADEKEEEPIQEESATDEEGVLTPQVETPVGKTFRRSSPLVESYEQDPVIAAIIDEGGLISKSRAEKENKEKYQQNEDLWNDAPYLGNPALNSIYAKEGGLMPDEMMRALVGRGLFGEYDSVSKMYESIDRAANSAKNIAANQKTQIEEQDREERLANLPTKLKTEPRKQIELVDSLNKSQPEAQQFVPVDIDDVDGRINLSLVFALEQRTGRRIILMEPSNKDDQGQRMSGVVYDGTIFINLDGYRDPVATLGHEFMHTIKKESPELYQSFRNAVKKNARLYPELVRSVVGQYYQAYDGDFSKIEEEALANIAGDFFMDRRFWDKFLPKEPKLSEKAVRAFVGFIDSLANKFRRTPRKGRKWEAVDALEGLDEVRSVLADAIVQSQNYNRIIGKGNTFPVLGDLKLYALDPDQETFNFDSAPAKKGFKKAQQQFFDFQAKKQERKPRPRKSGVLPETDKEIKDFGQKIGGARKDIYAEYKERMESYVGEDADITMAKNFPLPNYKQLLKEGVSLETLAAIAAIRDYIDPKPRNNKYKLRRWAETFRAMRKLAFDLYNNPDSEPANKWKQILDDDMKADDKFVNGKARETSITAPLARKTALYRALGFPDFTKAKHWSVGYFRNLQYDENGEPLDKPRDGYVAKYKGRGRIGSPKSFKKDPNEAIMELADQIKRVMRTEGDPEKEKRRRANYYIYKDRRDESIYIGKKVGRKVIRLKDFESVKDARAFMNDNFDEVEAIFKKKKDVKLRREDNRPREGERLRRPNENIDPDQFMSRFGFRGVEFGNYVENKRRQKNLNDTYDALNDLSSVLNIPSEALSLDSTLALAFGARGKGGAQAASAHYEPIKIAINLTKKTGAGSLAHEWFHGLDNYYKKLNSLDKTDVGATGYITEHITTHGKPIAQYVSDDVIDSFVELMRAIRSSDYKKRAEKVDETRAEPYFATNIELAARAFESYVIDKLADSGITNDFLANIDPQSGAYPTKEELDQSFSPLFDKLFSTMQYEKSDRGTKLFALDPSRDPVLADAARGLEAGTVTEKEYRDLVQERRPFIVVGPPEVLPDAINFQEELLKERGDKKKKIFTKSADLTKKINQPIQDGTPIEARIDIPSFNNSIKLGLDNPMYVSTAHKQVKGKAIGETVSYLPYIYLESPTFKSDRKGSLRVAQGAGKFPLATVVGTYKNINSIPEGIENWNEVGFDPTRSSEFIDIASGLPVVSGKNALQIGNRVYVEDAQLMSQEEFDQPFGETAMYSLDPNEEGATTGININDSTQPFTEQILSKKKTIETRNTNSLKGQVGKRVGLVRTGKGPALVVGYATIGEPIVYENERDFRKDVNKHRVAKGSPFDIQDTKYGYPLLDVKRERKPFQPKGKGIVSRQMYALDPETDAEYLELAKNPKKNEKALQKMVADAAKEAGFNVGPVKHHTNKKFNVFKNIKPDDPTQASSNKGFYFSELDSADSSGQFLRNNRVVEAYIKLQNPLEVEIFEDTFGKKNWSDSSFIFREDAEQLQEQGYDGVIGRQRDGKVFEYVVFEPEQIKSANPITKDEQGNIIPLSERFDSEREDIRFALDPEDKPPFYSGVIKKIKDKFPKLETIDRAINFFKAGDGVKKAEVEWMGIVDWIKENHTGTKPTVKKEDLLDFAERNQFEIILQENPTPQWGGKTTTQEGGTNYRELLFYGTKDLPLEPAEGQTVGITKAFRTGHFGKDNIIFHIRISDRVNAAGEKVLFIEEIQSDWASGYNAYRASSKREKELRSLQDELEKDYRDRYAAFLDKLPARIKEHNEQHEKLINYLRDRYVAELSSFDGLHIDQQHIDSEGSFWMGDSDYMHPPTPLGTLESGIDQVRGLPLQTNGIDKIDSNLEDIYQIYQNKIRDKEFNRLRNKTSEQKGDDEGLDKLRRELEPTRPTNLMKVDVPDPMPPRYIISKQIAFINDFNTMISRDYVPMTEDKITQILPMLKEYAKENNLTDQQVEEYTMPVSRESVADILDIDTAEEILQMEKVHEELSDTKDQITEERAPEVAKMPFVRSYHEPALKHIVRLAVKNNYAGISWATGAQQISLYNDAIRKNVSKIDYTWEPKSPRQVFIQVYEKSEKFDEDAVIQPLEIGSIPLRGVVNNKASRIHGKTLDNLLGKKVADEIREKVEQRKSNDTEINESISGDDLSVGGQVHKLLYDIATPSFLNKYTKRFNGKVGREQVSFAPANEKVFTEVEHLETSLKNLEILSKNSKKHLDKYGDYINSIINKTYKDEDGAISSQDMESMRDSLLNRDIKNVFDKYEGILTSLKNYQNKLKQDPQNLDLQFLVDTAYNMREYLHAHQKVFKELIPIGLTEPNVYRTSERHIDLRRRHNIHKYFNEANHEIFSYQHDGYNKLPYSHEFDQFLAGTITDLSIGPVGSEQQESRNNIRKKLEKANKAVVDAAGESGTVFGERIIARKNAEGGPYPITTFFSHVPFPHSRRGWLTKEEKAAFDAIESTGDGVRVADLLLMEMDNMNPQNTFQAGLDLLTDYDSFYEAEINRTKNEFLSYDSNLPLSPKYLKEQPYLKVTPEMEDSNLGDQAPLFALDPVEGKKLAAVKGKGEFAKALDRAPSGAILSAYDHIPVTEENEERLYALADKVEQVLQPVDDDNLITNNFKTQLASQVAKLIKDKQPKQIVEDLINERQRLENYEGHPDLLAQVQDREYEQAIMGRPEPVKKTKRQENFINLYNKHKNNPSSAYYKAAEKALKKDFGENWKDIAEGVTPQAGDTRYALDPKNIDRDYEAKKAQMDNATAELLKTGKKVKQAEKEEKSKKRQQNIDELKRARRRFFQGKYDYLDFMSGLYDGSGKAGDTLRRAEYNVAKVKAAVNEYSERLSREIKSRLGVPFWRIIKKGKRLKEFSAELHTTAARLNVESFNPDADITENQFTFRGFDVRMGFMPEYEAKARGIAKGSYITEDYEGNTHTLKLGDYIPEMEGYLLVQHYTAEDQQRLYNDFIAKYPDLGIILSRFINPLLVNATYTSSSGVQTPIFNRESLKKAFGDTELGDPGFVEGYTPDVAIATILGGAAIKARESLEKNSFKKRLGAFALKTSGARNVKTGAAREKGQTLDIFEGFDVRALEAHLERTSRDNAYKLIEAATKPIPKDGELPPGHIEISKTTLNGILKGMLLVMGDKSARGTSLNKFWRDAIQNPERSSYQEKVLFNENDANYDEREQKILEFLFGDKNASRFIGQDRMMDRPTYEALIDNLSARHSKADKFGRAVQGLLSQVISGFLTAPATILFNWLAPNMQAGLAGVYRINKAAIYMASGIRNPEDRRRAEYELRAGIQTLKGLATRRLSNYSGIDAFLTGDDYIRGKLTDEDYDKGALKLLTEGQIGKAIKATTDRRTKYGEIIPRELFENNTLVSGIERREPKDSLVKDLLNLKGGSAFLKIAQFHEMDPTVKQNLMYASYKAHAQMAYNDAVREAKARGQRLDTPKKQWIRNWMKGVKDTDPIHDEAYGTAMLFAFDYSNIPMWLDSKNPLMQAAKPALIPFSNFIYNYGKLLTKTTPVGLVPELLTSKGKKDKLGGAEWRNAASGFSLYAMGTLLWRMLGEEDDEESKLEPGKVGTNMDINDEYIKRFWLMTGGKINLDEMPDIFGEKITNAVRAYFEAYGAEKAAGQELWLRGRALPYLNILATQDLWIDAFTKEREKGEEVNLRDTLSETMDMAMEFIPRGPVMALFTENKYDENKTQAEEYADFTFDIVASRTLIPAPYWRFIQRITDPIQRRRYPSEPFQFNQTATDQFLNAWKRNIPLLSKTVMPAGSMKTLKLDAQTLVGEDEYTKTTSYDHAMVQREDVRSDLMQLQSMGIDLSGSTLVEPDKDGEIVIKYPDPATLRIVAPAQRIADMLFRIESMPTIERALGRTGMESFKDMDRLINKVVENPYTLNTKEKNAVESWSQYTQSPSYHEAIRSMINAEGTLADRIQRNFSKDDMDKRGIPKDAKPDFLRKVVENMSRDQYGNLVNLSDSRPILLNLSETWQVAPLNENAGKNPMNYMLINMKESTAYKRMRPYTPKGFEIPEEIEEIISK